MLGLWATGACVLAIFLPKAFEEKAYQRWSWFAVAWVMLDLVWAGWGGQPFLQAGYFSNFPDSRQSETSPRAYMNDKDEYALKFRRFFRFSDYLAIEDWQNLKMVGLPNINLLSKSPVSFVNNFDPFVPGRFARWMEMVNGLSVEQQKPYLMLMNVGVRLDRDVTRSIPQENSLSPTGSRFWWTSCATWVDDDRQSIQEIQAQLANSRSTVKDILILEGRSPDAHSVECEPDSKGAVELLYEHANMISLSVEAGRSGYLFLADTWFPGWTVEIDGQPGEILQADYLFRAVVVGAGKHRIDFKYSPGSFTIGAGISIGLLTFMILWMLLLKHRVKLSMIANQKNHS
jgi:hypothetical protein